MLGSLLLSFVAQGQSAPPAPTGITVSPGNASVTLGWTSGGNGSSAITKWEYLKKEGNTWDNDWSDICETSGDPTCPNKTSYTVTTLTNGTNYKFKVRAVNSVDNGTASSESDEVTPGVPPKPTTPTVEAGWQKVRLTASVANNGGSAITKWEYNTGLAWTEINGTNTSTSLSAIVEVSVLHEVPWSYSVRAVNSNGNGTASDASSSVAANLRKPVKPTTPTASASGLNVGLTSSVWSEGDNSVTRWEYKQKIGTGQYGSWTAFTNSGTSSLNHTVEGLTAGTKYTYKVRAVNSSGDGAESDASNEVTTPSAPPAPTGVTVSPGNASVTLGWTSGGNGGSAITKWQYQQKTGSTWANDWTDICETLGDSTCPNKTSYTVTTLTNGTNYKFKVRAVNSVGNGTASSESDQVTAGVPPKPTTPTVEKAYQKVRLKASITGNNGSAITSWEYTTGSGQTWTTWASVPGTNTSNSLTGIITSASFANKSFQVRVRAVNSNGNGIASVASNSIQANKGAPPKPETPTASVSGTSVTLTSSVWATGNGGTTLSKWQYKQKEGSNSYDADWTDITNTTTSLSYTVTGLKAGTKYKFKVRAVNSESTNNASAESAESTEVTTASAPPAPTGITVSPGNASVTLGWTSGGNGGSAITKWQYQQKTGSTWADDWTDICETSNESTCPNKTSYTVSTLTNGTNYKFKVRAVNVAGDGTASAESEQVTAGVPPKPTTLTVEAGWQKVRLTASITSNNGSAITKWESSSDGTIWTAFSGTNTSTSLSGIVTVSSPFHTFAIPYYVRAVNSNGNGIASAPSSTVTANVATPVKPETPTASVSGTSVTLVSSVWSEGTTSVTRWEYKQKIGTGQYGSWTTFSTSNTSSLNHTISDLTAGTKYTYKVRAVNTSGNGAESDASNEVTTASAPPAPTGITVSPGNASVTLGWTSGGNGGSAITKWQYQQKTGSTWADDWTDICETSNESTCPNKTSYTVSTLTNGTNYKFKVRAVNVAGDGTASAESEQVTAGVPPKPTTLTVEAGWQKVRLTASITSNNGSAITKWESSSDGTTWTAFSGTNTSTSLSGIVTVSSPFHTFAIPYYVRAVNSNGNGIASAPSSTVTANVATPVKPETPTASVSGTSVTLVSSVWSEGTTSVTRWEYKQKIGTGQYGSWTTFSTSNTSSLNHTISDLTAGTKYTYKVRAVNTSGNGAESDASNEVTTASAPPAPTGITVSPGNASVTLGWTSGGNGGSAITKWQYQQKTGSTWADDWTDICETSNESTCPNKTSYTVSTLTNGTNYKFKVRAVNVAGDGTASAESEQVTAGVPPKPTTLTVEAGWQKVRLTASITSNNGSAITKWESSSDGTTWTAFSGTNTSTSLSGIVTVSSPFHTFAIPYYVRAVNSNGNGIASAPSSTVTANVATPVKPETPTASASSTSVTLVSSVWSEGTTSVTRWEYKQKIGTGQYGSWTTFSTSNTSSLNHTISDLTAGTKYTYKVRAVNTSGNGAESDASNEVTTASTPPAPTGITVSPGNASVTLGWTSGGNGGSAITKWEYLKKEGNTWDNDWSDICTSSDAGCASKTSYTVTGLTNNTAYKFKIRAVNSAGNGAESTESSSVTPVAPTAPPKPSSFTVDVVYRAMRLKASVSSNGGSPVTSWKYRSKQSPSLTWSDWSSFSNSAGNTLKKTITWPSDATVAWQVRAVNANGDGTASDEVSVTTGSKAAPPKPSTPVATVVSGTSVTLTSSVWADGDGSGITSWEYKKKEGINSYDANWTTITSTSLSLSHTVTGLTTATSHQFKVRAVNGTGNSTESSSSTAVTPANVAPLAPGKPTGTGGDQSIALSWTSGGNGGSAITKWQYQQKSAGDYGSWTDICVTLTMPTCPSKTSYTVTGLTNGTAYRFKVRAANSVGEGSASPESEQVTAGVPPKPTLTVEKAYEKIRLKASITGNNGSAITRWEYTTGGGQTWTTWASVPGTNTANALTGIITDPFYAFLSIQVRVRAVNSNGNGIASAASSSIQANKGAPPKPETPTASVSGTSVTLTSSVWATGNGGTTLSKWQYKKKEGSNSYDADWTDITNTTKSLSYTVTGLKAGTKYKFKVRAVNSESSNNASAESAESAEVTTASTPLAPTGITVSPGNASVTLGWTSGGNGGSAITKWQYLKKEGNTWDNDWSDICTSSDTGCASKTSYTVTGLTNNTAYKFKIRAVNSAGNGAESTESSSVTPVAPTAPPKPSSFTVDVVYRAMRLKASVSSNGGSPVTSWKYRYKQSPSQTWSDWSSFSNSAGNTLKKSTNWTIDATVAWQVRAVNATGDGTASDEVSVTTGSQAAPPKPSTPVATVISGTSVTLTSSVWADGDGSGITSWEYKKKEGTNNYDADWTTITSTALSLSHTVTGLTTGQSHQFKVRAVNGTGNSTESSSSTAVTPANVAPLAPGKPTGTGGDQSVALSWTSGGNGGSPITKWQYQRKSAGDYGSWTDICVTLTMPTCPSKTSYTVTGLTNGTAYRFKVRAVNSVGDGSASPESEQVTAGVPPKPTLTVEKAYEKIRLKASITGNNGSAITRWEYTTGGGQTWTTWASVPGTNTANALTGIITDPFYAFLSIQVRVRAVNSNGNGIASAASSSIMANKGAPPKPETPTASVSGTSVTLTSSVWATGNGGTTLSKWQYKKKEGSNSYDVDWTDITNTTKSLSYTVTGLKAGTKYKFKVRAVNSESTNNASAESAESAEVTTDSTPPAPTGITVSPGNASVTLGWTSGGNGGSAITKWEYLKKEGNTWDNDWSDICTSSDTGCASKTSYTVTGLTNNTAYKFKIRAVNSAGNGAASTESSSVTPAPTAPPKPSSFTVDVLYRAMRLKASVSSNGGSPVTSWKYRFKQSPSQTWSDWYSFSASAGNTLKKTTTWLSNATVAWQVRAVNASGDGAMSDEVSVTTGSKAAPPQPSTPVATVINSTSVTLTSSVWADGDGSGITSWEYKKKEGTNNYDGNWTTITSTSLSLSHTVTGLTTGQSHQFKVRAVNGTGNSTESSSSTAVTPANVVPLAPGKPTGTGADQSIALSWTSGGNGGSAITKWQYQQKSTSDYGSWTDICATLNDSTCPSKTSYTVTGLTNGTVYRFKVRAVNSVGDGGTSPESDAITAGAVPPAPSKPTGTGGHQSVALSWTLGGSGSSAITRWQYQKKSAGSYGSWTDICVTSITPTCPSKTSYTVTGLTNATAYRFKVRAVNGVGNGSASPESNAITPVAATVPLSPSTFTGTVARFKVRLEATVSGNGGSPITGWKYKYTCTSGNIQSLTSIPGTHTSTSLDAVVTMPSTVTTDAFCVFSVAAVNAIGDGAESSSVFATDISKAVVPPKPSTPVATVASGTSMTLTSSVWADGDGSGITRWEYKKKEGNNSYDANWTTIASTSLSLSHTVTGLTTAKSHQFKVRAVNGTGEGTESSSSTAVTLTTSAPLKPTISGVTGGNASATLTWTSGGDGGSAITKWQYKKKEGNTWDSDWSDICTSSDTGCASKTSYTVTGLTNNRAHKFKIRAVNSVGNGAESTESPSVMPAPSVPLQPTISGVTGGNASATLTWTSGGNGGSAITKWEYLKKEGNTWDGDWSDICTSSDTGCASKTSYTVTGLTNNTAYKFKIRAVNSVGNGAESAESSSVTPVAPTAPLQPTISGVTGGNASATLTWTSGGNGGSAITKWQYQKKSAGDYGSWTDICETLNDSTCPSKTSYTVTGLTNNTAYKFKIRAVNSVGDGAASTESSSVTPAPTAPPKPSSFTVDVLYRAMRLKASVSSNGGSPVTGWKYRYKQSPSLTWSDWSSFSNSAGNTLKKSTNWTIDATVAWQVRAVNAIGDGAMSDEVSVTTGSKAAPPQPSTPVATIINSTGVTLTSSVWADGDGSGITSWEYKKKEGNNSYDANWTTITSTSLSLSHTVTGLTTGQSHQFKVRAVNGTGNSTESSSSTAVTPANVAPLAPGKPTGTGADQSVALSWTSGGNGGSAITKWQYQQKSAGDYGSWTDICETLNEASCPSKTSYTVTGLTNGTAYRFKVRAANSVGDGSASPESDAITSGSVPSAPTISGVTGGNASATLTWTSGGNGGSAITKWQYQQKTGSTWALNWSDICETLNDSTCPNKTSYTVTTLTNGTNYKFKVRAVNSVGNGTASSESGEVTVGAPPKPTLTVEKAYRKIRLTASITGNNGSAITHWEYTTGGGQTWTTWASVPGTNTANALTGIITSTIYEFTSIQVRVRAVNSNGNGIASAASSSIMANKGAPPKPETPTASVSGTSVTLTSSVWATGNGGTTLSKWQYKKKEGSNSYDADWTDITKTSTSLSHTVTGLKAGTKYKFKVRAVNSESTNNASAESAESTEVTTANAPPAPTGITVSPGNASVTLGWTSGGNGGGAITKWQYKQKTGSTWALNWSDICETLNDSTCPNKTSYTVTTLTNGTNYKFKVRAVNATGDGTESAESAQVTAGVPPQPTLTVEKAYQKVRLTASITGNSGSSITRWEYSTGSGLTWSTWASVPGTNTTNSLTGIITSTSFANSSFKVRVRAVNSNGDGLASAASKSILANKGAPPKPAKPTATVQFSGSNAYLILRSSVWATGNGGTVLTKWQYKKKKGNNWDENWTDNTRTSTTVSFAVFNLTAGATYKFKMRAVNSESTNNTSEESEESAAVTIPSVPPAPTGITVSPGNVSVTLGWTSGGNGGSAITEWQYKQKTGNTWGNWKTICLTSFVPNCPNRTSNTIAGLTNGTNYRFKVRAVNDAGDGAESSESDEVTAGVPPKPTLTVEKAYQRIRVKASLTSNIGLTIARWEYRVLADLNWGSWGPFFGTNTSNSLTKIITSASFANNPIKMQVRAVNSHGNGIASAESNFIQANKGAPPKPETPTVSLNGLTATLASSVWATGNGGTTLSKWQYKKKEGSNSYDANWTDISNTTTSLSFTVTGLQAGTKYKFKVRAVNSEATNNASAESAESAEVTTANVPPAPTGITVSPGNASVTLGWTSGGNGGSAITKWQYQKKAGNTWDGSWSDICETSDDPTCPNKTSYTVTTLTNGTSYKFKVRAVSSVGDGTESSESAQVTAGAPPQPTLAVEKAYQKVRLKALITGNGGSTVTRWEYSVFSVITTSWGTWASVPGTNTSNSLTGIITNANFANNSFKVRVRAVNSNGDGIASAESNFILANKGAPPKPEKLTVSLNGLTATLTSSVWATGNGGTTLVKWQYKKKEGNNSYDEAWTDISNTTTSLTHTVTGLTAGTKYKFKVRAVNSGTQFNLAGADSESDEVTTANVPLAPTGVTVSSGNASVTLGWTSGGNGGSAITKWQYQKKAGNTWDGSWSDICETSGDPTCPNKTSYTVTTLTNGTNYRFKVRAVNAAGDGAESSESAQVTAGVPPKPTTPTLEKAYREVRLTASLSSNNGSSITNWQYSTSLSVGWFDISNSASTTLSAIIYGLTWATNPVRISVRAVNSNGTGPASDTSNVVLADKGAPPKPETPTASVNGTSVTLTSSVWATGTSGTTLSKWQYKKKEGSNSYDADWTDISSTSMSLSHTVTSLTAGTKYKFKVRAVNSETTNNTSAESAESAEVTTANVPPAPGKPTGTAGNLSVALSWTSGGNGGSAITKWEYKKKTGNTWDDDWSDICTSSDTGCASKTSYTVTGLTSSTAYKFKVRAINSVGNGSESPESDAITPLAAVAPLAPTISGVTGGNASVTLTWTSGGDGGSAITKWEYKKKEGNTWDGDWSDICTSSDTGCASRTSYTVTGLTNDTAYKFKIRAVNSVDNGAESAESSSVTPAATAPLQPTISGVTGGNASATLTWTSGGDGGSAITEWEYKKKEGNTWDGDWSDICTSSDTGCASKTSYTVTGLTNDTAYKFKIRAVNSVDNGAESAESDAVTPAATAPPAPGKPTGTAGNRSVVLSWTSGGNGGSAITEWEYQKKSVGSYGSWTDICVTSGDSTCPSKTSYTVTGLTNNTAYKFKVRAVNSVDNGSESPESDAITPVAVPKPSSFSMDVVYRAVRLKASVSSNGGSSITSWKYRFKPSSSQIWTSWISIANSAGNTLEHVTNYIDNLGTVAWQVRAVNANGDGAISDEVSVTIGSQAAPPKPSTPVATVISGTSVTLTSSVWTDGNGLGITSWEYKKKEGANSYDANWTTITSTSLSLSHTLTGLTTGLSHQFKVRAVNGTGNSTESSSSTAVTPANVAPLAPGKPTGTGSNQSVALSWTSGGNGGSAITKWQYRKKSTSDYGSWTDICATLNDANCPSKTSYTVTGLTNGTAYRFKVRAVNSVGDGSASPESDAITPATLPPAPGKPTGTAGNQSVALSWTSSGNGGSAITRWQYQKKSGGGYGSWTDICNTGQDGTCPSKTSYTVTGLTNATAYKFKIRAVNSMGDGSASPESEAITPAATLPPAPGKPTGTAGHQSVALSWTSGGDGGSEITKWQYQKKSGGGYGSWTDICVTLTTPTCPSKTSYTVTGLTNSTAYRFKVRAVNSVGDGSASSESDAITPVVVTLPPAPGKPTGTAGHQSVALSWTSGGNGGGVITKWQYQKKSGGGYGSWTDICVTSGDSTCPSKTSYTVTELTNNTAYKFKVRAVNSRGDGSASPESDAITPAPTAPLAPGKPTGTGGHQSVALSWTSGGNGGSAITKWQYQKKSGGGYGSWTDICVTLTTPTCPSKTSYTVTGLTNATAYRFKVRAVNNVGDGSVSPESDAITPATPTAPLKPGKPTVTGAHQSVALTWTSGGDGGSAITKWQYKTSESVSNWTDICETSGDSTCPDRTTYTVTGLTNGKLYRFRVRAINSVGDGPQSLFSDNVSPVSTVPPAPGKPTGTVHDKSVGLSWTSGGNGGSAITRWQYQKKSTGDYGGWTDICVTKSDSTCPSKTSYTVTGLTNGRAYRFKVRAVNSLGSGSASPGSDAITPAKPTAPPAPGKPTGTAGHQHVALTWTSGGNGGSAITKWQYKKKEGNTWDNDWSDICTSSDTNCPSRTSYTVTGLTNATAYKFKVRAVNSVGNGTESPESEAITPTTTAPPAPGKPTGTAGHQHVALTWTSGGNGGSAITKWQYKKKEGNTWDNDWSDICTSSDTNCPSRTSYTVTGLTNATAYKFKVRAVNSVGNGTESPESEAITPTTTAPPAPGKPTGTAGHQHVALTWTSGGNGGSAITKWQYMKKEGNTWDNDWSDICTSSDTNCPSRTSYTVTGLTNATAYKFKVRAVNSVGNGTESPESEAITPTTTAPLAPGKPTGAGAHQSVVLSWTSGGNGGSAITKWEYKKKEGNTWDNDWSDICTSSDTGCASKTSYTVTGLTNATAYKFKVRAVNSVGNGAESPESEAITPVAAAPPAPGKPTGTAAHQSVALTWTPGGNEGEDYSITKWQYKKKEGNTWDGDWSDICETSGDSTCPDRTTYTVTGLTNNTAYKFKVRAVNTVGDGAESPESEAITPTTTVPLAPGKPTGTSGNQIVTLSWTSGGNGGSAITKWQYKKKEGNTWDGDWSDICVSSDTACASKTSYTVTGLTNATAYKFKVRAANTVGDGAESPESEAITPAATAPPAPGKPTGTAAHQSVVLSWTSGGNGGSAITKWQYQKKLVSYGSWTDICETSDDNTCPNRTSYTVTGLMNGEAYKFKVRAVNTVGDGSVSPESEAITPTTTVPPAPSKPTGTSAHQSVALTWTSGGNGGRAITKWEYMKKEGNTWDEDWSTICTLSNLVCSITTTYTVTGLTNNTAYKFKVRAINSLGNGVESPESDAITPTTTVPLAPGKPTARRATST